MDQRPTRLRPRLDLVTWTYEYARSRLRVQTGGLGDARPQPSRGATLSVTRHVRHPHSSVPIVPRPSGCLGARGTQPSQYFDTDRVVHHTGRGYCQVGQPGADMATAITVLTAQL